MSQANPPFPEPGSAVPDFTMPASHGRTVSLDALRGQPFVLYFYPKANTSGCTREACEFQAAQADLQKDGVNIIGVSRDGMPAIEKFAADHGLTFPLASDADGKVTEPMACGWKNPCTAANTWASNARPSSSTRRVALSNHGAR